MRISKVTIENFKCFRDSFTLELSEGLNVLVGDNESGKSTIVEAIHLALTGYLNGRYLKLELSQDIFNNASVAAYLDRVNAEKPGSVLPPAILIEIYLEDVEDDSLKALYEGNGNSSDKKACGFQFHIAYDERYQTYYEELVATREVKSLPVEYYDFCWNTFARDDSTIPSVLPIKSALIDSSNTRTQNGSDLYISRIVRDHLSAADSVKVAQAHRHMRDSFSNDPAIKQINSALTNAVAISDKKVEIVADVSARNSWDTSLTTCFDSIPFHQIGKGEQALVKTRLALAKKKTKDANLLLVEEPECHLSHSKLIQLLAFLESSEKKQMLITTHNSFVANKLGLDNLVLLSISQDGKDRTKAVLTELTEDTQDYFRRLAGYDTLRLLLCKRAILVEGASDELVVQKAYMQRNTGKLPIQDGIDVISVGTAFLRFLEIAEKLGKNVSVVTDNDGDPEVLADKYSAYSESPTTRICCDNVVDTGNLTIGKSQRPFNYNTLEPKIVKMNGLERMNIILGTSFTEVDELHTHMFRNKTECALSLFNSAEAITFPPYIEDAIAVQ